MNLKITADGKDFDLASVSLISITPSKIIQLLARTPRVSASKVNFIEFYPQGSIQWRTRTYGQNLKITGLTEFSVVLSDSYSALENVKLGSSFQRYPPIVMFDVLSTFPTAIFWTLILLPIFVSIMFVLWSKNQVKIKRRGNSNLSNPNV